MGWSCSHGKQNLKLAGIERQLCIASRVDTVASYSSSMQPKSIKLTVCVLIGCRYVLPMPSGEASVVDSR